MRPILSIFSSKPFRQAVSILVLLALLAGGVGFLSRSLRMNDGYYKNRPFLEDDRSYDVVFYGTSHVINSVYPMLLWKDYGITSYNLAIHGGSIAASYWMLRNSVEYHKPKIAVMDVLLTKSQWTRMENALAHAALDPFPLTKTKVQAIWDIFPETRDRMEMLFPLDVFHNRWKDLDTEMLLRGAGLDQARTAEKGAESRIRVYPLDNPVCVPLEDNQVEDSVGLQYLGKFIEFCQESDIIPVITYLPYRYENAEEEQRYSNAALELARSLGAATIDLQHTDLIDDETDWYDMGSHVNPTGAKKITRVLGEFLKEHYALEDHRQDAAWAEDYEAYYGFQRENLLSATDLWDMLTILSLEDFSARVELGTDFPMDTVTRKLLDSLGTRLEVVPGPGSRLTLTAFDRDGAELLCRSFQAKPTEAL